MCIRDSALVYSTYLGGIENDWGISIAVDAVGSAVVAGTTISVDFPTKFPLQASFGGGSGDAFVTRFTPEGSALYFSTYLGGPFDHQVASVALDATGNVYLFGMTPSTAFPVTMNAFQSANAGNYDTFITKLSVPSPTLSPAAPTVPPKGTVAFVASGGTGPAYVYSLDANASGAALDSATGNYVAGATPNVNDKVSVIDAQGGTASATITVGPGVSLAPTAPSVVAMGSVTFVASGGSGTGFVYALKTLSLIHI